MQIKAFCSDLKYLIRTKQQPYSESIALEKTRRQTEYEAILDQVSTHTPLFLRDCVVNMSLQNQTR